MAENGLLSTPAASNLIRINNADGGILLTASHNPGGPDGDFGIKFNVQNGGPAPEAFTDKVFEETKKIKTYKILDSDEEAQIEEVSSYLDYLVLMNQIFDLHAIRPRERKILVDSMSGVTGPYVKQIVCNILGVEEENALNVVPLPDFGGKHPDPNLTYASELVDRVKKDLDVCFAAAFDGDGDRNMVIGRGGRFVSPGDALAIIANNKKLIKRYQHDENFNFARSFPTAPAVDRVAKKYNGLCYETPTGWKFFGNLLDAGRISMCGEESFGIGAEHIREKDGLWACLAWLNLFAKTGKTIDELLDEHWKEFGRDYFVRYDFEECDLASSQEMLRRLETLFESKSLVGTSFGRYKCTDSGNFAYEDPVENKVYAKQGLFVKFNEDARIIFRMSGTGSTGATVRLYVSDYHQTEINAESREYLRELIDIAYEISNLKVYLKRDQPSVIT